MSPVLVLVCSSILWGLTWWPLKGLHARGVDGIPLILVGYGTVAVCSLPLLWKTRRAWLSHKRMMTAIAALGGVANLSFASALVYGDVVRVMVLFYLLPLWGVVGGRVFLGEQIDRVRALTMVLALSGAFLVLGGPAMFDTPPTFIDFIALLSGFAFAMNNICFRASQDLPVPSKVPAMFVGCAACATFLLAAGVQPFPTEVAPVTWGLVVAFGLGVLVATLGTQFGVTHLEAGKSSIIMILELLSAAVSAAIIGRELLSPLEMVGGIFIVGASLLEARSGAPVPEPAPQTP